MAIDTKTVMLIIGIVHLMQVSVFAYQYKVYPNSKGLGWWLLWSAAESVAFFLMLLRANPKFLYFAISLQNIIIVGGTLFVYIGLMKILDQHVKLLKIFLFLAGYAVIHLSLVFIRDEIYVRSIIVNGLISLIAFFTVYKVYKAEENTIKSTTQFILFVLFLHGMVFFLITGLIIIKIYPLDLFSSNVITMLQLFDALIVGLLWTFGFIIMINEKLNLEILDTKNHFESLFEISPDSIVISRLNDGVIIECNENYFNLTGFPKDETIGVSSLSQKFWNNPQDRKSLVKQIQEMGFCNNFEFILRKKNGELITALISSKKIVIDGVDHMFSVIRDISERKFAEEIIKIKNSELEKLNAAKDKFFSIIAHDLKAPFNSILGFSELLSENIKKRDSQNIIRYADVINQSSRKAVSLLLNLMEWTRSQTGKLDYNPEKIKVHELLSEIMQLFLEMSAEKKITIESEIPENIQIYADKDMISTVIRNLISNAFKFTNPGGNINIIAKEDEENIVFSVIDNGVGISENILPDIFKVEHSYSTKGTMNEQGTGLGLILCKEFVEKHGGKISVTSKVNQGSNFCFTVPKKKIPDNSKEGKS